MHPCTSLWHGGLFNDNFKKQTTLLLFRCETFPAIKPLKRKYIRAIINVFGIVSKLAKQNRSCIPDLLFHNSRASKSGDGQTLCSSKTSIDGFWGFKIMKKSVGSLRCKCVHSKKKKRAKHTLCIFICVHASLEQRAPLFYTFIHIHFCSIFWGKYRLLFSGQDFNSSSKVISSFFIYVYTGCLEGVSLSRVMISKLLCWQVSELKLKSTRRIFSQWLPNCSKFCLIAKLIS